MITSVNLIVKPTKCHNYQPFRIEVPGCLPLSCLSLTVTSQTYISNHYYQGPDKTYLVSDGIYGVACVMDQVTDGFVEVPCVMGRVTDDIYGVACVMGQVTDGFVEVPCVMGQVLDDIAGVACVTVQKPDDFSHVAWVTDRETDVFAGISPVTSRVTNASPKTRSYCMGEVSTIFYTGSPITNAYLIFYIIIHLNLLQMKVIVISNLKAKNNAEVVVLAGRYVSNMSDNSKFGSDEIVKQLGIVKTKSEDLSGLMSRPIYEGKSTDVAIARDNLDREITILCGMVEAIANSSSTPDGERTSIVRSAGMDIKTQGSRSKRVFSVCNGDLSGMVKLLAEGGAQAHEWQYTADVDKFSNRIAALTTTKSSTEISGLDKGDYAFFHKAIFSDKMVDWEGPIVHTVV